MRAPSSGRKFTGHRWWLGVVAFGCALSACVPLVVREPQFEVRGGVEIRSDSTLGALSPSTIIYFPFHGVYLSFSLKFLAFGLHIPNGTEVRVDDPSIRISGVTGNGSFERSFIMRGAPQSTLGGQSRWRTAPDPFYAERDFTGTLRGEGSGDALTWYLFMARDPEDPQKFAFGPADLDHGVVTLPSLTINDQRFDPPRLPFRMKHAAGVACGLCN